MVAGSTALTSHSGSFTAGDVGKYIQVIGAGPGATTRADANMSAGSPVLTSASGTFSPSDVGRGLVVIGAGTGGEALSGRIQNYSSSSSVILSVPASTAVASKPYMYGAMTLEASIVRVQDSSTVNLSAAALSSISSAEFAYGTDNHASFQAALDSAGRAGGGTVTVPSPASCPASATCGYVVRASDQMTAKAPAALKIRYSNLSLVGDGSETNLFCRGAFGTYANSVAFPGTTGNIRGFCLSIGDDGGPNGVAGESVSNVTISNLHFYGMTNGNTFQNNFAYPPAPSTTDGWDITHKAIYLWSGGTFSNITIDSLTLQDFKAENIFSGGSPVTGMVIKNSTITNFNGDGISMLAADLQVVNNAISNGSNAAIENSTVSSGASALVQQLYRDNRISQFPREGIVVVGVDGGVASGTVQILDNYFDTIAQINRAGTASAVYIASQNNSAPPANVTVKGNTCHDCYSFGVFDTSGNTLIQSNTFVVDQHNCANFISFTNPMSRTTISNNSGYASAHAQANGISLGAVYGINPGYASGAFPWKNVILNGNTWAFSGAPQYQFVTSSGLGWNLVTQHNLNWQKDVCTGCTHADVNHGLIDLSKTTLIRPYGPVVVLKGNSSPVSVSVDASKEEEGAELQLFNAGSNPVTFHSDGNLSLTGPVTLSPGGNPLTLVYHSASAKFALPGTSSTNAPVNIVSAGGTPQSAAINTPLPNSLKAFVTDADNNPVSGVRVTFAAPGSGASLTFGGAPQTTALTGSNGIATASAASTNGQVGNYSVTASFSGSARQALYQISNTASTPGPTGGVLGGAVTSAKTAVDLSGEGLSDWVHWGDPVLNRKAGDTPLISSYQVVGSGGVTSYSNDPRPINWADGSPDLRGGNQNGIYTNSTSDGLSFSVSAGTSIQTLSVHVGGWLSAGRLTAHLSDSSAPDYVDQTTMAGGQFDRNYSLTFKAGSAGQTFHITWMNTSHSGNVTLNAAALH